jgi:four helix bundle protein
MVGQLPTRHQVPLTLRSVSHRSVRRSLYAKIQARELCQAVFVLINRGNFGKDMGLKNQIWKAAGSTMDNIVEGFEDGSSREFIRFLGYSQRSCSEVQSQLYRALDCKYIGQNEFGKVYDIASECRKQVKGFRKYLRDYDSRHKEE